MRTKTTLLALCVVAVCALPSSAQPAFDSSGNSKLNGAYYMRQVLYFVADSQGDIGQAINVQGTITFDGSGGYTFSGSILDSATNSTTPVTFTASGTYSVSASGQTIISAVDSNYSSDQVIGLVSQNGIFIGSTTENGNGYNDLFIAAPIGTPQATNASLNGSYTVAYIDPTFLGPNNVYGGDAFFTMNPNGQGNIGTVNVTGYVGANTTASTQTLSNVTYSFTNGAAQINFGGNPTTALIAGTHLLYISPDNNFIFGGSYNGFDMFVGVRGATSKPSNYNGLYYQAGLDLGNATISSGYSLLDSYYGALQAVGAASCGSQPNCFIGHQRVNSPLVYGAASDFSYYDAFTLNNDGSSDDALFGQHYISSTDGTMRVGYGIGPYLALNVAFLAPNFSGSGVYLSPVGVVNAASSAPFTAFLAPGEFITLYGSGLASSTQSASVPFPTSLNNVQVLINQVAAPIYYVSPNQISVIVPYITSPGTVAQIQVVNNGTNSNVVTQFTGSTAAGAFTNNPVGGIGIAAAERPDYSIISSSNPAQLGETISVYLAGMGAVSNQPADGAAAPSNPLSQTTAQPAVYLSDSSGNNATATVTFSGLAPGFAGLYQINFTIPSTLASGVASLEIQGTDSDNYEAILPLGAATPTPASVRAHTLSRAARPQSRRRSESRLRVSGATTTVRRERQ